MNEYIRAKNNLSASRLLLNTRLKGMERKMDNTAIVSRWHTKCCETHECIRLLIGAHLREATTFAVRAHFYKRHHPSSSSTRDRMSMQAHQDATSLDTGRDNIISTPPFARDHGSTTQRQCADTRTTSCDRTICFARKDQHHHNNRNARPRRRNKHACAQKLQTET